MSRSTTKRCPSSARRVARRGGRRPRARGSRRERARRSSRLRRLHRASTPRRASAVSRTSWTRSTAAPRATAARPAPIDAGIRSATSRPRSAPNMPLRDDPHQQRAPQRGERGHARPAGRGCAPASCRSRCPGRGSPAPRARRRPPPPEARGQVVAHLRHHVAVARGRPASCAASPRMCTRQTAAPRSATSGSRAGSPRPAVTSLTRAKPASSAAAATGPSDVSIDRAAAPRRPAARARTPASRRSCSSGVDRVGAGARALGAHVADGGAVGGHRLAAAPSAPPGRSAPPPPQSESGVTLRIPMTHGGDEPGERVGHGAEATPPRSAAPRVLWWTAAIDEAGRLHLQGRDVGQVAVALRRGRGRTR